MVNLLTMDAEGHKVGLRITDREQYFELRNSAANRENFNKARDGDENAKRRLLQFNYNDQLPDGVLRGCHTAASTFAHDIDCHNHEECQEIARRLLDMRELLQLQELSVSPNWGLHAVCMRQLGKTILENQIAFALLTHTEMDCNAHDQQRVMFTGPADEETLLYLDDRIFLEPMTREEGEAEYARLKEREQKGEEELPAGFKKTEKHHRPWEDSSPESGEVRWGLNTKPADAEKNVSSDPQPPRSAMPLDKVKNLGGSVPANIRSRFIIGECLKESKLQESDLRDEGGRHNAWLSILSVGAAKLLTQAEIVGIAQELAPAYSQEENFVQLVRDFYQKYNDPSQKMTTFQRRVFSESRHLDGSADPAGSDGSDSTPAPVYGDLASLSDIYANPAPPMLSAKARPAFVRTAIAPVPEGAKETGAQAMFPPLGMYCDACFVYIDGTPREPRLNCLIIAGTGSGKDSSTKHMLNHLMAPRQQEDAPNRVKLEEWKQECKRKESKNEDKPPRPNVDVRSVAANITPARLSELMADSQGRIIHTYMFEFDQWFAVEGWKPGTNCPFTNLKLTDDEDNPFGQERVGKDSITYRGPLSINWNASTTTSKAQYFFRNVMTDGPISRLCLATTHDSGLGAPMPKHGKYDQRYDDALKPYIDNLRQAHGELTCNKALRMVNRLKQELDDFVVQTGDEVLDNLGHRALVQVFRKATLLFAANGMKWERSIEGFCRWSLHYDLWLKLHFFGDLIRSADKEVKTSHRGPRNLLEQIQTNAEGIFSLGDAENVRLKNGRDREGTTNMLSQWVCRGFIEKLENGKYMLKGNRFRKQ
ncbi:MAG: hypothetical protein J5552_04065 [Prevotella sp.]|nr:hypothetical protein [Prevotella sp.]